MCECVRESVRVILVLNAHCDTALHYNALHYTTLHYTTLHYSHCTTHYTTLLTLHYTTLLTAADNEQPNVKGWNGLRVGNYIQFEPCKPDAMGELV
jgi:hypothetical protein